jgi:hypothetical protein
MVRGYYLLDELQTQGDGSARLLRRFWFNRVNAVQFARIQTFDDDGVLTTDIVYSDFKPVRRTEHYAAAKISLTRPQDHYEISLTLPITRVCGSDKEYQPEVFRTGKQDQPAGSRSRRTEKLEPANRNSAHEWSFSIPSVFSTNLRSVVNLSRQMLARETLRITEAQRTANRTLPNE